MLANSAPADPSPWSFIPFILLLLTIAIFPLVPRLEHFWEKNRNKLLVALVLGFTTLLYFLFRSGLSTESVFHDGIHDVVGTFHHAMDEYIPFIVLLFALYTISGGIHLAGDIRATPRVNTLFLAVGTLLASFIGTTGASMLLIRPLLRTNMERKRKVHTVVFFIFTVSNIGGCLTPLGDPPLYLGYLKGVDFWWTLNLFFPWLVVNSLLLFIYYLWDRRAYSREDPADIAFDIMNVKPLRVFGGWNFVWLLGVVLCVALLDHRKPFLNTSWTPFPYFREGVLLIITALSWFTIRENRDIRAKNEFNFEAILEVAALFVGIFICMQPPVQYLNAKGEGLGVTSPEGFFWATGILSSFLDNAPTYVVFFETAKSMASPSPTGIHLPLESHLFAISLGAVFMGANTYIGNGPNFMVKAIAEKSGVAMPSFFGFMVYSGLVLIPIFLAVTFIFL